jgi:GR25 family glycosyltransferase involved in LPS biosynthesis
VIRPRRHRGQSDMRNKEMDCFYINLDSATQRRAKLENNFAAIKKPHWNLTRFAAVDTVFVKDNDIKGATKPAEKACFLSHKFLIGSKLAHEGTIFIVEDDATFGIRTCNLIDAILKQNKNMDWDILFADVCIPQLVTMVELLKYRRELSARKVDIAFLELSNVGFAGSTAYLINGKSKQKIYDLLDRFSQLDLPYDLYLRYLIHTSALKGFSLFPFVTSLSEFSEMSQIKLADTSQPDLAWNMFRKMIWVERNLDNCKSLLGAIKNTLRDDHMAAFGSLFSAQDEELNAFGILFSSMASNRA